jgi:integrase
VLNTAVQDGLIDRNPCTIPRAGNPRAGRRPIATPAEIAALADVIKPEYKAAVLLGAWAGLRRGEILGLFRDDIDLDNATVTVRRTQTELASRRRPFDSPPKTDAGYRTVALPRHIMPAIEEHLANHSGRTRVFIDRNGDPMRGDTLYQAFSRARAQVGLPHLRFHDLRHTGQTLAAATGASLPDLMKRLGHASPAAAMRYLHTVDGRDRAIADALSTLAEHGSAAALPDHLRR